MSRMRLVLGSASVAIVLAVVALAVALGPAQGRRWLMAAGGLAAIASVQAVASDPRDLTAALVLALIPVIALLGDGSPTWVIGPLAVLLLLAGELNALSWECRQPGPLTKVQRARLVRIIPLAGIGLAGSLAIGAVPAAPAIAGTAAVALGGFALAVLARLLLRRSGP